MCIMNTGTELQIFSETHAQMYTQTNKRKTNYCIAVCVHTCVCACVCECVCVWGGGYGLCVVHINLVRAVERVNRVVLVLVAACIYCFKASCHCLAGLIKLQPWH